MSIDKNDQISNHGNPAGFGIVKMYTIIAVAEKIGRQLMEQSLFQNIIPVCQFVFPELVENRKILIKTAVIHMDNRIITIIF